VNPVINSAVTDTTHQNKTENNTVMVGNAVGNAVNGQTGKSSALANILIVDDTPANLNVLTSMLTQQGYKVRPAISGEVAVKAVAVDVPDLILLDIRMPNMNGYEVCQRLKSNDRTMDVPIIFISALDDLEDKLKAFEVGGVDYITKPFQIEEVLARVQSQLMLVAQRRQIESLSDLKDELIRIVSHDMKNPLSVIIGYSEMILESLADGNVEPRVLNRFTTNINRAANNMLNLVSDLLGKKVISDRLPLVRRSVSLSAFLNDILVNFGLPAQVKNITLEYKPCSNDVQVNIDPARMSQVFNNLLSNAIKYTPAGGTVTLYTEDHEHSITVYVSDTGLGIPQESLPHIFDKFYRVNSQAHLNEEGTGIGLSIVKGIVELHQGSIRVESEEGKGSLFSVTLPKT
jgi:two-component system, sensor histidine kinase and response regulator